MVAKPVLQALVLADHIYTDTGTGKRVIAGTFNQLWVSEFPAHFGRTTWAYICLTELVGEAELALRYVDLSDNKVLMELKGFSVTCGDPLRSVEIACEIPPFVMPHPGAYALEVHAGGELLGSVRVIASQRKEDSRGG